MTHGIPGVDQTHRMYSLALVIVSPGLTTDLAPLVDGPSPWSSSSTSIAPSPCHDDDG